MYPSVCRSSPIRHVSPSVRWSASASSAAAFASRKVAHQRRGDRETAHPFGADRRRRDGCCQRPFEASASLHDVAALLEERAERASDPEGRHGVPVRLERVGGGAEVVELRLDPSEPLPRSPQRLVDQVRLCLLGEREEPFGVASAQHVSLARGFEPLPGELPDRLVHPEAAVDEPDEALLHEGLERVEVGFGDVLRHLEGAAAREDREAREQPLLVGAEQVVGPLDRRAERSLARVGVAAARQQVETLREPFEDLRR